MPYWVDTQGKTKVAIGICGRCSRKMAYSDMVEDPNFPGLWVCKEDQDVLDPYRLPARESENIALDHPRPDVDISGVGPTYTWTPSAGQIQGINPMGAAKPWQPNTWYNRGDTVTVLDPDADTTTLPTQWLLCLISGWSGPTRPTFPVKSGVLFKEPV